ncbi:MAG: DUF6442 family protein [Bulleidia sp.]
MNKEEILEKSRKENQKQDEMERDAFAKAGQEACAAGGLVCMVIIIFEAIFSDHVNLSTWAVYLSMTGTMLIMKYHRLKKRRQLYSGLLQVCLAAVFLIMYLIQLVR